MSAEVSDDSQWKRGLPPGKYHPGMELEYEVYYSPGGVIWHRKFEKCRDGSGLVSHDVIGLRCVRCGKER